MDPARPDARGDAAPAPPSHDRRQYRSHRCRDEARYLRRGLPAAAISVPAPCRVEREAGEEGRGGERGGERIRFFRKEGIRYRRWRVDPTNW